MSEYKVKRFGTREEVFYGLAHYTKGCLSKHDMQMVDNKIKVIPKPRRAVLSDVPPLLEKVQTHAPKRKYMKKSMAPAAMELTKDQVAEVLIKAEEALKKFEHDQDKLKLDEMLAKRGIKTHETPVQKTEVVESIVRVKPRRVQTKKIKLTGDGFKCKCGTHRRIMKISGGCMLEGCRCEGADFITL